MKNYLKKFLSYFTPNPNQETVFLGVRGTGAVVENIYEFSEVVGASAAPEFKEKNEEEWRTFFQQYQFTSSACVAFTLAKIVTILYFLKTGRKVKFSPGFWYPRRANKPQEGMFFDDIARLGTEGALLNDLLPCEGFTEAQMNALVVEPYHKDSADGFALPKDWVNLPLDFDTVAATIERTGKGIMTWFTIRSGEFFQKHTPAVRIESSPVSGHSMCAVDTFRFLGVPYILYEDSAEKGFPLRLITRDFFRYRAYLARYPINFKFEIGDKPTYDGTIISAQKCLRYEGFFPSNIAYAENVGKITTEALRKFQTKHGLSITGTLSGETVQLLQKLYA